MAKSEVRRPYILDEDIPDPSDCPPGRLPVLNLRIDMWKSIVEYVGFLEQSLAMSLAERQALEDRLGAKAPTAEPLIMVHGSTGPHLDTHEYGRVPMPEAPKPITEIVTANVTLAGPGENDVQGERKVDWDHPLLFDRPDPGAEEEWN